VNDSAEGCAGCTISANGEPISVSKSRTQCRSRATRCLFTVEEKTKLETRPMLSKECSFDRGYLGAPYFVTNADQDDR